MTSRCLSRELAGWFGVALLAWGTLLACAAKSVEGSVAGGGQGADSSGGSNPSGGSIGLGGELMGDAMVSPYRCDGPGLKCRKVNCPADSSPATTSVSGTVYDPAGRVPLYNAVVYVVEPDALPTLDERAQCEECKAHFPSGGALAVARTDANGRFRVPDMPTGTNVPLVIQLGKWRRQVRIEQDLRPCTNTELSPDQTRLPRNSAEGHLPKIAVTTGASDKLECLLRKVGVDLDEFTPDSEDGRVNLFAGFEAATSMTSRGQSVQLPPAEELWADAERMLDYDMILMSCEGDDNLWNDPDGDDAPPSKALPRPLEMHLAVRQYADLGGRIFGSHWHHRWINSSNVTPDNPYPEVAKFARSAKDIGEVTVSIDATFPKGAAFQDWLFNVGASTTLGSLDVVKAEHSVDSVVSDVAQRWIYGTDPGGKAGESRVPEMVQYFSFTTPVGEPECGRMVFSDVHVSFGADPLSEVPFPERCDMSSPDSELSPQEKALEFMLFDLSSCIQKERDEVPMPITVVK